MADRTRKRSTTPDNRGTPTTPIQDRRGAGYWEHVRRLVDEAPPLSPTQIAALRVLLGPGIARARAERLAKASGKGTAA